MEVDYMESEMLETLNYLRPPIQRNYKELQEYLGFIVSSSNSREKESIVNLRDNKSSLSLFLQKTCKEKIYQKFSSYSIIRTSRDQKVQVNIRNSPIIQVAVISKTRRKALQNILEKRLIIRNKESSGLKDKSLDKRRKVILTVVNNTHEIYESKTENETVRDEIQNVDNIDVDTDTIMDKIKNSSKYKGKIENKCPDLTCECRTTDELDRETHPKPDRVRIVGQIGLNQNSNYIMKCAATVNGEPVVTSEPKSFKRQSSTGRDKSPENSYPIKSNFYNDEANICKEKRKSQATQIDKNYDMKVSLKSHRNIQCNLCDICTHVRNQTSDDTNTTDLNRSTSPLVVISVYPNYNTTSNFNTEKIDNKNNSKQFRLSSDTTKDTKILLKDDLYNTQEKFANKSVAKCCPCDDKNEMILSGGRNKSKKEVKKTYSNDRIGTRKSRSPSPGNKSLLSSSKAQERKKNTLIKTDNTIESRKMKSKKSPSVKEETRLKSPIPKTFGLPDNIQIKETQIKTNSPKLTKKLDFQRKAEVNTQSKDRPNSINREGRNELTSNRTGTQTERLHFTNTVNDKKTTVRKKAPIKKSDTKRNKETVDKMGNQLTDKTIIRKHFPFNDISKVSINIDSDKEVYDVVFEKSKVGTDFSLRRKARENFRQKYFEQSFEQRYEDRERTDSLANLYPPDLNASRKFEDIDDNEELDELTVRATSTLNVRDSLEIGHRRELSKEDKSVSNNNPLDDESETERGNYSVPRKHYVGDKCRIKDPLERDREIRELLGVNLRRSDKKRAKEENKVISGSANVLNRYILKNTQCNHKNNLPYWECDECRTNSNNMKSFNNNALREEEKSITDDEKQGLKKLEALTNIKRRNVNLQARIKIPLLVKEESTQYSFEDNKEPTNSKNITSKDLKLPYNKIENMKSDQSKKAIKLTKTQYRKIKREIYKVNIKGKITRHIWIGSLISLGSVKAKKRSKYIMHWNREVQTNIVDKMKIKDSKRDFTNLDLVYAKGDTKKAEKSQDKVISIIKSNKNTASSVEMKYTSVAYNSHIKKEPYVLVEPNLIQDRRSKESLLTIYRGHKKCRTPNLGPSALSLLSEEDISHYSTSTEIRKRKPFLKRLFSCLIMKVQNEKLPSLKQDRTVDSSFDSYYISTSLGAIEMSSSLYDTTASFYSNHTIDVKKKRSMLSSFRGLLNFKQTNASNTRRKY